MGSFIGSALKGAWGAKFFPVLSMIIFIVLFISLMVWVFKKDKKYVQDMKNLPLEDDAIIN